MVDVTPIVIDGVKFSEKPKKLVIKRFRKENIHVSVPIVSYLPLKCDDLFN